MRMRTRRKWWLRGTRVALSCWPLRACGSRRLLLRPLRGGWRACPRAAGWGWVAGGPGRDLAAQRADLGGSGGGGRRGAAVFAFRARLGRGNAMREVVSAGGNSLCGLHPGAGKVGPGVPGVCAGGVCGSLGGVGVPWGVGLLAVGVCWLPGGEGW